VIGIFLLYCRVVYIKLIFSELFAMASLGHFIFELIKIGILSTVYTSVIIGLINIARWLSDKKFKRKEVFFKTYKWVYATMFVFMFTYWGNHGLGDDSYIPIGHFKTVDQSDLTSYITVNKEQHRIKSFAIEDNKLFAMHDVSDEDDKIKDFIIWDLKSDKVTSLDSEKYIVATKQRNYPSIVNFKDFNSSYQTYWNGWRFWLLP